MNYKIDSLSYSWLINRIKFFIIAEVKEDAIKAFMRLSLVLILVILTKVSVGQTNPKSDSVFYSNWRSSLPYVSFPRPDSESQNCSNFVITPSDTLQSFYQAGRATESDSNEDAAHPWYNELSSNVPLGDSTIIWAKLSSVSDPNIEYYISPTFFNKKSGGGRF